MSKTKTAIPNPTAESASTPAVDQRAARARADVLDQMQVALQRGRAHPDDLPITGNHLRSFQELNRCIALLPADVREALNGRWEGIALDVMRRGTLDTRFAANFFRERIGKLYDDVSAAVERFATA